MTHCNPMLPKTSSDKERNGEILEAGRGKGETSMHTHRGGMERQKGQRWRTGRKEQGLKLCLLAGG